MLVCLILRKKSYPKFYTKNPKKIPKKEKFLTKKNPKNPLTIYTHYIYFAPSSSLSLIKKYQLLKINSYPTLQLLSNSYPTLSQ